ncbi:peptidyl-prolyl cis-trans isomerase [Mesonia sp. K7]|uniref:peptidyl-prolyl cis-trans isomerase n=1 Tax=Mesonia sp. K7 TaxID=2218606 RepID=UPI000DAA303C|nr:peptidyl-prolyl cis-trans isomerase [Mesonia sp. K7]PZD77878.1 peptidyl-prolyl cis-trans isomerase [Mesonia sp. K7]
MRTYSIIFLYLVLIVSFASCDFFVSKTNAKKDNPVARVHDHYLYKSDIDSIIPKDISGNDSILFVSNYINQWANKQLLMHKAKYNLSEEKQKQFERLIKDYKTELYTEAYKEAMISKNLDTLIADSVLRNYYNKNKENFKLNQDLVKLRYINIDLNYASDNNRRLQQKLIDFDEEDIEDLNDESIKFKSFSFNDSVWVSTIEIYDKIGPLSSQNKEELLKKENFLQLKDSLGVYLIYVKDYLKRNDQSPLEFVRPTIKQVLLNQQKIQISKKLEKDILDDAIQNKNFETYD